MMQNATAQLVADKPVEIPDALRVAGAENRNKGDGTARPGAWQRPWPRPHATPRTRRPRGPPTRHPPYPHAPRPVAAPVRGGPCNEHGSG